MTVAVDFSPVLPSKTVFLMLMNKFLLLIPPFYRSRIPETGNKTLQHSQEHQLNLLAYWLQPAVMCRKKYWVHGQTSPCSKWLRSWKRLLPLVPASLPEGITYYHRAPKFMPVAAKENSRVSLNGFNGWSELSQMLCLQVIYKVL